MNTDEHRYERHAENGRFTRWVKEGPGPKSVFICVHPWFMNSLSGFNGVIQDHTFLCVLRFFVARTSAVSGFRWGAGSGRQHAALYVRQHA
jgi:hypothetical protein